MQTITDSKKAHRNHGSVAKACLRTSLVASKQAVSFKQAIVIVALLELLLHRRPQRRCPYCRRQSGSATPHLFPAPSPRRLHGGARQSRRSPLFFSFLLRTVTEPVVLARARIRESSQASALHRMGESSRSTLEGCCCQHGEMRSSRRAGLLDRGILHDAGGGEMGRGVYIELGSSFFGSVALTTTYSRLFENGICES